MISHVELTKMLRAVYKILISATGRCIYFAAKRDLNKHNGLTYRKKFTCESRQDKKNLKQICEGILDTFLQQLTQQYLLY